jgi:hypothetical protein
VLALVPIVKAEAPEPATEVGANEALAPTGSPAAEKPTVPEKPPTEATDTV